MFLFRGDTSDIYSIWIATQKLFKTFFKFPAQNCSYVF